MATMSQPPYDEVTSHDWEAHHSDIDNWSPEGRPVPSAQEVAIAFRAFMDATKQQREEMRKPR